MPIIVSGSTGSTIISGSGATVSGSDGSSTYGSGSMSGSFNVAQCDFTGSMTLTGSLTVSGSNTITNYGSFISNEAGEDFDFRVESKNMSHMFFVDGGTEAVQIGASTGAPAGVLEVNQSSFGHGAGGIPALLVTAADIDQIAVAISGSQTIANIVNITASALTTGKVLHIDHNDTTTAAATPTTINVDFDKHAVKANSTISEYIGVDINMNDGAVNHAGSTVTMTGIAVSSSAVSTSGTNANVGIDIVVTGSTTNDGIRIIAHDSAGSDIKMMSSLDNGDYCTIAVGAAGATTITTVDDGGAAANLTFTVDGDITMKPAGGNVTLHDGSNNVFDFDVADPTFKIMDDADQGDYFSINVGLAGLTTMTTVDDGGATAHLSMSVDGDIVMTPAGTIRILDDAQITNYCSIAVGAAGATTISTVDGDGTVAHLSMSADGGIAIAPAAGNYIVFNEGGADVDFRVATDDNTHMIFAEGSTDYVGIATSDPKVTFDVHYTASSNGSVTGPETLAADTGGGEVVYFGSSSANLTAGGVYYLNEAGGWAAVDAHAAGTGHNQLLGISLGTNPHTHGMLTRGFFHVNTFFSGAFIKGGPIYLESGTLPTEHHRNAAPYITAGGYLSGGIPGRGYADGLSGSAVVRVVGYGTNVSKIIYFNPDATYVDVASE